MILVFRNGILQNSTQYVIENDTLQIFDSLSGETIEVIYLNPDNRYTRVLSQDSEVIDIP